MALHSNSISREPAAAAGMPGAQGHYVADSEGKGSGGNPHGTTVEVHCDYLGADAPIRKKFPQSALLAEVKEWARGEFVPVPPSGKAYYLNDDKTRHRFTAEEEQRTLLALGYEHKADLRLGEEHVSG